MNKKLQISSNYLLINFVNKKVSNISLTDRDIHTQTHAPHTLYLPIAVEIVLKGNLLYSVIIGDTKIGVLSPI